MNVRDAIRRRVPERWTRRWPHVRASLVALHALAVVALSFPSPPGGSMQRSAWDNPTVQNEMSLWAERLRGAGIQVSAAELDAALYDAAKRYLAVHDAAVAPLEPYATYAGTRQNWQLFAAPQRYPVRLEISVREGSAWRTVYEDRSDEHTWKRDLFDHYRLRRAVLLATWDSGRSFKMLCDWVAAQAARDFPAATEVMIRQIRYRTPTPAEALSGAAMPERKYVAREVRKLGAQR